MKVRGIRTKDPMHTCKVLDTGLAEVARSDTCLKVNPLAGEHMLSANMNMIIYSKR